MKKASIFFLGYLIFEFPVLKLTQVYIFNSIWRFLHVKVRLKYSKKGNFWQAPPASQIKIFKKGKIHTYRIIPSFRKTKKFVYWIKTRRDILPQSFADRHTHTHTDRQTFSDSSSTKVENNTIFQDFTFIIFLTEVITKAQKTQFMNRWWI